MDSFQSTQETNKNQALLQATEKIETVMGLDQQFQAYQKPAETTQVAPAFSGSFIILWCAVLVAQALMFWGQKKQKQPPKSAPKKQNDLGGQIEIDKSDRYQGEAQVTEANPHKQRSHWVGRVAFQGSYWRARSLSPVNLETGDICEVIGISKADITLIVRELAGPQ